MAKKSHSVVRGQNYHIPDIENINMFKEIKYKIGKMIGEQRIKRTVIHIWKLELLKLKNNHILKTWCTY